MTDEAATSPEDADDKRMPFLEHLGELRNRLRNSLLFAVLALIGAYMLRVRIFAWLALPLFRAFKHAETLGIKGKIIYISPMEQFMVYLKTAAVASVFMASPMIFYQLWAFIAPGLYAHEKRWALPFVVAAVGLFVGGALFCYHFVLPPGYDFFLTTGRLSPQEIAQLGEVAELFQRIEPNISMDEYYGLTLMLLLVFGVVFELPLLLSVLSMLGVVSAASLWRWNRYAILVFAIGGAVLTPGDLVIGQLAMTGSLTVLYNLSIVIAWLVERKRRAQNDQPEEAAQDTHEDRQENPPPAQESA